MVLSLYGLTVYERFFPTRTSSLVALFRKELQSIESQIDALASLLTEVKHRRALIQWMDALDDQRQELVSVPPV